MSTRPHSNYRKFTAPRFLKKFHNGGEAILQAFFVRYLPGSAVATANPLRVDDVITFVQSRTEMTKEATQLLNDANDLGNLQGAFFLRNALTVSRINPPPARNLIPEHLSLKVLTEWPEVFVSAYDRLGLAKTDNFSFYAGREVRAVQDPVAVAQAFETELRALKRSEKVVVRSFIEGEMVNFIFYHEKAPRAPLVFQNNLEITPLFHRPAQQDFICYNTRTGHVEIEIGSRGEQIAIRKKFAQACTGEPDFFEQPESTGFLTLDRLMAPDFTLNPEIAKLRYIQMGLEQEEEPCFEITSKDVYATLTSNGLLEKFQLTGDDLAPEDAVPPAPEAPIATDAEPAQIDRPNRVQAAHLALVVQGQTRPVLVELTMPNKISFPRSMHSETVFTILRGLDLLST